MTIATTIMRTAEPLRSGDTVERAREILGNSAASALPVLDADGRVLGFLKAADIDGSGSSNITELMHGDFITAGPLDSITDIEKKLSVPVHVVVVDDLGLYLGLIEEPDLKRKT